MEAVDGTGNPIPTSAVLTASAKHIGIRCMPENMAFLKCKKNDPTNPEKCLDRGRDVRHSLCSWHPEGSSPEMPQGDGCYTLDAFITTPTSLICVGKSKKPSRSVSVEMTSQIYLSPNKQMFILSLELYSNHSSIAASFPFLIMGDH